MNALRADAPHKWTGVYGEALEDLRGQDLEARCRAAGYLWDRQAIRMPLLGRSFVFSVPGFGLVAEEQDGDTSVAGADGDRLMEKILLLHYLRRASGAPLSGRLVGFDQLEGGMVYASAFRRRTELPLAGLFARAPERLPAAAGKLDGGKASFGDVSALIAPFPKVPMTLIVWTGDDEMPPNGKVLFDDTAGGYLSTEDLAVLGGLVIRRLKELIGTQEEPCRES